MYTDDDNLVKTGNLYFIVCESTGHIDSFHAYFSHFITSTQFMRCKLV